MLFFFYYLSIGILFQLIVFVTYFVFSWKATSKDQLNNITGIAFLCLVVGYFIDVVFYYLGIESRTPLSTHIIFLFLLLFIAGIWFYRNKRIYQENKPQDRTIDYQGSPTPKYSSVTTDYQGSPTPKYSSVTTDYQGRVSSFLQKTPPKSPKNAGVAAILNFLIPGAGYIYGDQFNLGMTILLSYVFGIPVISVVFLASGVIYLIILTVLIYIFALGIYFYQIFDVYNYLTKFEGPGQFTQPQYQQPTPVQQASQMGQARPVNQQAPVSTSKSIADQMREYKQLLEEGVITEEEFAEMKKKLIEMG